MNICSVTSCEDKTINLYLACNQLCKKQDFNVFIQPVRGWRWCHILHTQALSLNVSQHYTRFFSNHSQPPMTHLSLNLQILAKAYHSRSRQLCQLIIFIQHPVEVFS